MGFIKEHVKLLDITPYVHNRLRDSDQAIAVLAVFLYLSRKNHFYILLNQYNATMVILRKKIIVYIRLN